MGGAGWAFDHMASVTAENTRVPLLDLRPEYDALRDELIAALVRVADSQHYILGAEVEAFEREVAGVVGARRAVGVSSGTDAILISLMALGIAAGDEVITPAFSFFATAGCVTRLGARPVFVDIDPDTYALDVKQVAAAITSRTRAIAPVHLFGLCADMDPLLEVAGRHGIAVIEDAAQAIGASYNGRAAGSMGAFGCFSFFPSKNLGAFGDAGLVTVDTEQHWDVVRMLRVHGARPKYVHRLIGGNFRLDPLQAAVLRVKLPHLRRWTDARRANATRYRVLFRDVGLDGIVGLPVEPPGAGHAFNQFVIRVPRRDDLRAHLAARGIGTEVYYPVPFHLQECFAGLGYRRGAFPISERAAEEVLALPVYPALTAAQQQFVAESIAAFFGTA